MISKNLSRRDILKSLATIPVLGYFAHRFTGKYHNDLKERVTDLPEFIDKFNRPQATSYRNLTAKGNKIRIGVVGNGMRGPQIFRALGFASEDWVKRQSGNGVSGARLQSFLEQEDLNVEITGVCDTFLPRAEDAVKQVTTKWRAGNANKSSVPKVFPNYRDMLADNNVDALVILTPDHWHAKMATDAAIAGKHVYLEKPMCQSLEEAKTLRKTVQNTGIVLQVGHQNRQQASYIKAAQIVNEGILGDVSLIETFTNRNDDHGAWIRGIPENANSQNVNWKEFLGEKEWREFDLDRFFNWQKWFEFGTGPAGNQFTHEYDCINQILYLGIPDKVVATGGNYFFKDDRDIPDVLNVVFDYEKKGCTLTYDCTLRNSFQRDKMIFGQDASMQLNIGVSIFADAKSEKYKKYKIPSNEPMIAFHPKFDDIDAVTSATAKYYQERGFGYTYQDGRRIDATYLHMKEWLYCIRNNMQPSCDVNHGYEETATFYMANRAYLEKKIIQYDHNKEMLV
ncbi:MAG: Gfo/Idh/MocA family protein [Candidatus Cyclobacteriaceae bacterium M3_2C_046]